MCVRTAGNHATTVYFVGQHSYFPTQSLAASNCALDHRIDLIFKHVHASDAAALVTSYRRWYWRSRCTPPATWTTVVA